MSYLSPNVLRLLSVAASAEQKSEKGNDDFPFTSDVDYDRLLGDVLGVDCTRPAADRDAKWFGESIARCAPLFRHSFSILKREERRCDDSEEERFRWLAAPNAFREQLQLFLVESEDPAIVMQVLQKSTPILERSLGNIFISVSPAGTKVPSLLRDLIASEALEAAVGKGHSVLLALLFGSPKSLNIRNLLWHGFVSPGEIRDDAI